MTRNPRNHMEVWRGLGLVFAVAACAGAATISVRGGDPAARDGGGAGGEGGGSPDPGGASGSGTGGNTPPPPGQDGGNPNPPPGVDAQPSGPVSVTISPRMATVQVSRTFGFTANVTGANPALEWSIQEGAAGGTVTSGGAYTAPRTAGTFHVVARSVADASKSDTATVTVTAPSGVRVFPEGAAVASGQTRMFSCTVNGAPGNCRWTLAEGAACGSITAAGLYTAPAGSRACHVVGASAADPTKTDQATVWVPPAGPNTTGWTKITPPVTFRFAMCLVVDPVRPNDYYSFVTNGASTPVTVLKSTDYGASWAIINSGTMRGDPWGCAIDTNPTRDPSLPPTLYTPAGYGSMGLFKSVDGGATWTQLFTGAHAAHPVGAVSQYWPPDLYSVAILPDDPPNHIVLTYHAGGWRGGGDTGFLESTDGGQTWTIHPPPAGIGQSQYLVIADASTWITVAQDSDGSRGTWRTTTAGRTNGAVAASAWRRVDMGEHFHGDFNAAVTPQGIYVPSSRGIRRTTDKGATWTTVYNRGIGTVVATGANLYGTFSLQALAVRATLAADTSWAAYGAPATFKAGMVGPGTSTIASSFDGTRWHIVANINDGGIWRYSE